MQVRPITSLSADDVRAMARAAADNGEPLQQANVFATDTPQHTWFTNAYWARHRELTEVEA